MKIIEYNNKYLENVKDLLVELEEYLISIDGDKLDRIHPDYRDKMIKVDFENLKNNKGICLLAIEKNKVLGVIMGSIPDYDDYDYLDYKCPKRGTINELIVTKKVRSTGIGKLLIKNLEEYFINNNCEYEIVDVFAYNKIGINFYNKNNFHNRMHTMIKKLDKDNYECKIADIKEIETICDYEINNHKDKNIWEQFKINSINGFNNKSRIVYIGKINNNIICEATAIINKNGFKGENINIDNIYNKNSVYLCSFRTNINYINKGYFRRLYNYMEKDLKDRGFKYLVLGVEPKETRNIMIYFKLGFTNYIKTDSLIYPNGEIIMVNFYRKELL